MATAFISSPRLTKVASTDLSGYATNQELEKNSRMSVLARYDVAASVDAAHVHVQHERLLPVRVGFIFD